MTLSLEQWVIGVRATDRVLRSASPRLSVDVEPSLLGAVTYPDDLLLERQD
jgi:hypothetical protein